MTDRYTNFIKNEVAVAMAREGGSARVHLNFICTGFLYDKPAWIPLLAWQRCTKSGRHASWSAKGGDQMFSP